MTILVHSRMRIDPARKDDFVRAISDFIGRSAGLRRQLGATFVFSVDPSDADLAYFYEEFPDLPALEQWSTSEVHTVGIAGVQETILDSDFRVYDGALLTTSPSGAGTPGTSPSR